MQIHILKLCVALLAPESTGLDPHGRALHLPLVEDFTVSHSACIATAKQARRLDVDPFVMAALTYRTNKFSPKLAAKSKIQKNIRQQYGCEKNGQFIKSSCSSFMLDPQYFRTLLNQTVEESTRSADRLPDYRKALCRFLTPWSNTCTRESRKEAKIIENMAFRFANVYGRSRPDFTYYSPFKIGPTEEEVARDERRRERQLDRQYRSADPYLNHMLGDLGYRRNRNGRGPLHTQRTERDLMFLYNVFGNDVPVEAVSNGSNTVNYFVHISDHNTMKQVLWYINGETSRIYEEEYYAGNLRALHNGVFEIVFKSRRYELKSITIKVIPTNSSYQVMIFRR